jgi:hypothetical protein
MDLAKSGLIRKAIIFRKCQIFRKFRPPPILRQSFKVLEGLLVFLLATWKPIGMVAMKIISPLSIAEQGPWFLLTHFSQFWHKQTGLSPSPLHSLHRQAINTSYSERTKTKREAEKELLLKILNVNSAPLNFIYNWKSFGKHHCALANADKTLSKGAEHFQLKNERWRSTKVYSISLAIKGSLFPITVRDGSEWIFNGLSQNGGRADFSKNLLASLFNKYVLSMEWA